MGSVKVVLFLFGTLLSVSLAENLPKFKICIPKIIHKECVRFLESPPSNVAQVECITGRDRMDCLEKVNQRKADFLFVDPEDMYVAYHINNQDFSVFAEIRSTDEPLAEFRYEGIILVRKGSDIHSLSDLKGKKSCHTGYGRNVGFKIPITKLKNNGVLKVSQDVTMSPVEKELKALSDFFEKGCLVGRWSPNEEVNKVLKKRYSNLCQMCEDPEKCGYPDRYSGYDGAIRCLTEKDGDVAFTKTIFVKQHFGLPIGNGNTSPVKEAESNPDDYEYLCEDGSRLPVTGPPCSWAQRPWQGYMGNADVNSRLQKLQDRIKSFYEDGKASPDQAAAKKMQIKANQLVYSKPNPSLPGEHLTKAGYKDVIERDGSVDQKIRFCVSVNVELKKCSTLKQAAYSRDIRPDIMCILKTKIDCIQAVKNGEADVVVIRENEYQMARNLQLNSILYEAYGENDTFVAVVSKVIDETLLKKGKVSFDPTNLRSVNAALLYSQKNNVKLCPNTIVSDENSPVKIMRSSELDKLSVDKYQLICKDLTKAELSAYKICNFEYTLPTAIFSRSTLSANELDNIIHAFSALSDNFGHGSKNEDVFELFAEFETGAPDVLFDDEAAKLVTGDNKVSVVDEALYKELRCY